MDEFLSLCAADEQDATDGESFVTASSEITVDRTVNSTDMDSFLSAKSVLPSETDDDYSANISNEPSHHDQTITNDIIQSQIDELDRKRREVINLARATVFGSGSTENRKDSRLKSGPKLVDLDFSQPYINSEPATSKQFSANSDSSDDEMMGRKKPLTESGKLLKKQLAKVEEIREFSRDVPVPSMKPKETVLTGVAKKEYVPAAIFDNFFRLRIRNPKISSTTFDCYVDGHRRVRMSELRLNTSATADSWTTAGVVVNRDVRKSVNGKDYLIWKLHDLKDCQDPPVTLLLFGEACKEFWKLQVGICVALMTPQIADNDQNSCVRGEAKFKPRNTLITLKVFKSIQVVELGFSSDLGTCKGVKLDGQKCSNFVNISLSEFCVHHVMKEARKLSAKRGAFNSITSHPPPRRPANAVFHNDYRAKLGNRQTQVPSTTSNLTGTIHPIGNNVVKQLEMKTITKAEERTKLKEIIGGRSHLLGARNMTSLTNPKKIGGKVQSVVRDGSMLEFIKKQPTALKRYPYVPKLGTGLRGDKSVNLVAKAPDGSSTSSQDPARIRAIAILKRRQEATGSASKPLKRKSENKADQESPKRSKLSSIGNLPNLDILLRKKSIHDSESNKAQGIAMQKHLDSLEQTEKVETFASECMAVKNVRIVSCKKCGYTAQKRSELCMREGHYITKGTAEKRFFKCSSCQRRTVAYGIMPTKACKHCHENEWVRVAMKDERKVQLENEKLLVRGEERKFVSS